MEAIAAAVYPSVPEALPAIERALSGAGAPDGMVALRRQGDGGLEIEWDPSRTSVRVIMGLIDAELRRYNATRRTELRRELSLEQLSLVAAQELQAPQIAPDSVLEALLARAGYDASSEC